MKIPLVNNLYHLICSGEYITAKKAVGKLQQLTADADMLSWKVPMLYYDGLLDCVTDNFCRFPFSCQINEYPACPMTRYAIYAA